MCQNWGNTLHQKLDISLQIIPIWHRTTLKYYELIHIKGLPKVVVSCFKHFPSKLKSFMLKLIETYVKLFHIRY